MKTPDATKSWEPRLPMLIAIAIFVVAALTLCYPMLQGRFLGGEDQVIAGYAFRLFGADYFRAHHSIPQWNPYIFGGLPFSAVIGHGDIFYPTAWLRWFVPVDFGMSFGFFFHIALAGFAMYSLIRGLGMSWTAAVTAGVAYQLSGNLSSMMNNGHDGKLFVGALAPFAFLALFRAVRNGKAGFYGVLALVIGLAILTPAVQVAYYLMVACGILALWLVFLDPQRRPGLNPILTLFAALGSVFLGLGISMIQIFPILSHVKYTPRAVSGPSTGWDYATSYSFHIKELPVLILPQFNGMLNNYVGSNGIKTHTEYLGVIFLALAIVGFSAAKKRNLLLPFGCIAGLFLLVSFGADTPFYSLWYHMPMMSQVRAAGMAFYLVGLCIAVFAACGIERLLAGEVQAKTLYIIFGILGAIALLGAAGALQGLASVFADPRVASAVLTDPGFGDALRAGSLRLMLFVGLGAAVLLTIQRGTLKGAVATAALIVVVGADSWSILRNFSNWLPPASEYYAADPIITEMKKLPLPYRVFDPSGRSAQAQVYEGDMLMAQDVPTVFGYHGMESFYFDSLFGTKNDWENQLSPALWDLYAANFIVVNKDPGGEIPGYHKVLGPIPTRLSRSTGSAFLFERDTLAPWVRVVPQAVPVSADEVIPKLLSKDFPTASYLLIADSTISQPSTKVFTPLPPSPVKATLTHWEPGAMTIHLEGSDTASHWLLISENWYPDWHATIDGVPCETPTHESCITRVDHAMMGINLPKGAKDLSLVYDVPQYHTGKWVTIISTLLSLGIIFGGSFLRRTVDV